jgi:putative oxidoreductase
VFALTLLRVGIGLVLANHGLAKLNDLNGTIAAFAHDQIPNPRLSAYLAILGELGGGLGLALGALTKLAALGPLLVMSAAIYFVHREHGMFASDGGWEYPMVILLVAVYFVIHGAGPLSVDHLVALGRRRSPRRRHHRVATT